MTLLADRLAQRRLQALRADDVVLAGRPRVQLAGAVAALAADGVPADDRFVIAVARVFDRLDAVDVTVQAGAGDDPADARPRREARRQIPDRLVREPAD